jgi:hypothetical protein
MYDTVKNNPDPKYPLGCSAELCNAPCRMCTPLVFPPAPQPVPMTGGPCVTNSANWDNDRWIQCTGKPKPVL